jgi:NAD(P)-dependent dehydrogenase (short-subunit alcohol dehydrogenase family)
MPGPMNKKTVVITGASSGIGFALAKAYLEEGFNVVGNARSTERLQTAWRALGAPEQFLGVEGDIGQPETAQRLFASAIQRFEQVHVLVNNAGIFLAKPFVEYSPEELAALVSTNLHGFVYASQEAARHMIPRKEGHIINVTASIALQPLANVPATVPILIKGGLNQATKALALELAPHNVKVSAVAPGIIDTPLYTKDMHAFLDTLQPVGHMGTARDITDAVLYLTRAEFTTGVVLAVDGGMSSGRF